MIFAAALATVEDVPTLDEMRQRLRKLRREREFTLDQLSETSGVDRAAIHKIEKTERYPNYEPGLDTFRRLVEGLGVSLAEFFAGFPAPAADELQHKLSEPGMAAQVRAFVALPATVRAQVVQAPQAPRSGAPTRSPRAAPRPARKAVNHTRDARDRRR